MNNVFILEKLFLSLLLISIFLLPPIKVDFLPFSVGIEELLIVIFVILIFVKGKFYVDKKLKISFVILFLYIVWIFFTIVVNNLISIYNSYFEIYKLFKVIIIIIFLYNLKYIDFMFIIRNIYILFF
jgi:hypothetical protein